MPVDTTTRIEQNRTVAGETLKSIFRHTPIAKYKRGRKTRNPIISIAEAVKAVFATGLLVSFVGCATVSVHLPAAETRPLTEFPYVQTTNGLTLAFLPLTNGAEVKHLFGANLLEDKQYSPNVLPVLVVLTNTSAEASYLVSPDQFSLLNGARASAEGSTREVKERLPDAAETIALHGLVGWAIFHPVKGQQDASPVGQHVRDEELPRRTLPPGGNAFGYVYFGMPPKTERQPPWVLMFKAYNTKTKTEEQLVAGFDWQP